jgi:hypothetical protein
MTTTKTILPPDHHHFFNHHTGRPRFHFDESPPPPPPPAPPPPAVWHTGVDAELLGHAQNKGWDMTDPKAAFAGAVKQARELERHFGVPPDRLVKLPAADAKPEEIAAFRERLGVPKEPKDYDFSPIKDAAGQPIPQALADALRASAHAAGVPKDAAAAVARDVVKHLDSAATEKANITTANQEADRAKLKANWGDKFEFNRLQAMEGARKLGISPEAVAGLESVMGYSGVMDALRKIGINTREGTFIEPGAGGSLGQATTVEGALARKAELMADQAWGKRFLEGGAAERAEMNRLDQMISGVAA